MHHVYSGHVKETELKHSGQGISWTQARCSPASADKVKTAAITKTFDDISVNDYDDHFEGLTLPGFTDT
jgi:hypothetical protein